eukprot:gene3546-6158_t
MNRVRKRPVFEEHPPARRIKVITVGCVNSGKSCLIKRFCERRFVSKYIPTIGIDYGITTWNPPLQQQCPHSDSIEDTKHRKSDDLTRTGKKAPSETASVVSVNFYDMSGDDVYYPVRNEFYEGSQGVLLVFDVLKRSSFESLNAWYEELQNELGDVGLQQCVVVVCGNKADIKEEKDTEVIPNSGNQQHNSAVSSMLPSNREVLTAEAEFWAHSRGFYFYETSAKTGYNIDEMFHQLLDTVFHASSSQLPPTQLNCTTPQYLKEDVEAITRVLFAKTDYAVLNLQSISSITEVQRAYKTLVSRVHPDKNRAPGSEDAFKRLLKAKDTIVEALSL